MTLIIAIDDAIIIVVVDTAVATTIEKGLCVDANFEN